MPQGLYFEKSCSKKHENIKKSRNFQPTKHQRDTFNAFIKSKYKGMLLFHKLGSGKTCTAIMIADEMLRQKRVSKVFVITPGSLRQNWITEYCQLCGNRSRTLRDKFWFLTYNYNIVPIMPDFKDSLVIVDEIHNVIYGYLNKSVNPTGLYESIENSNCRVLALTGTPIYHNINELAPLMKLLKPSFFDKYGEMGHTRIFKTKDGRFVVDDKKRAKELFSGIISYYPGAGEEFSPKVIYEFPIIVQMTPRQIVEYDEVARKEVPLSPDKNLKEKNPKLYKQQIGLKIVKAKYIPSRGVANFYYPEEYIDIPDTLEKNGGWVSKETMADRKLLDLYSPKFSAILMNIIYHIDQKHVIYTFFKTKHGAVMLNSLLTLGEIKSAIFSGDLTDSRKESLLRDFNSSNNIYGDKIRVLIITEAGNEGISIKDARHLHIVEGDIRYTKIRQAIGRVARYKSHLRLPKDQRNVHIWAYWAVTKLGPPDEEIYSPMQGLTDYRYFAPEAVHTRDAQLYYQGVRELMDIDDVMDVVKQYSITPWEKE